MQGIVTVVGEEPLKRVVSALYVAVHVDGEVHDITGLVFGTWYEGGVVRLVPMRSAIIGGVARGVPASTRVVTDDNAGIVLVEICGVVGGAVHVVQHADETVTAFSQRCAVNGVVERVHAGGRKGQPVPRAVVGHGLVLVVNAPRHSVEFANNEVRTLVIGLHDVTHAVEVTVGIDIKGAAADIGVAGNVREVVVVVGDVIPTL